MRTLLVVLLALSVGAVAADRVAEHLVTSDAEQQLAENGVKDPQVDVSGFPFLTQLASRRFDAVTLTGSAAEVDGTHVSGIRVQARQVELPDGSDVTAGGLRALVLVPYTEVLERAGRQELEMSPARGGRVRLRGEGEVLGQRVRVAAVGRVRVVGTRLVVRAGPVSLSYSMRGALPEGVRVRRVVPAADGFRLTLYGQGISFDPSTVG